MLYGFSLLYGFAGTTNLYAMAQIIMSGQVPLVPLFGILLLDYGGLRLQDFCGSTALLGAGHTMRVRDTYCRFHLNSLQQRLVRCVAAGFDLGIPHGCHPLAGL